VRARSFALIALAACALPAVGARRPIWTVTVLSDSGRTATLAVRVSCAMLDRPYDPACGGSFRCRGDGCVAKRGRFGLAFIHVYPLMDGNYGVGQIGAVEFRFRGHPRRYCTGGDVALGYFCGIRRGPAEVDRGIITMGSLPPECGDIDCYNHCGSACIHPNSK
jgi:hypothetical protein